MKILGVGGHKSEALCVRYGCYLTIDEGRCSSIFLQPRSFPGMPFGRDFVVRQDRERRPNNVIEKSL